MNGSRVFVPAKPLAEYVHRMTLRPETHPDHTSVLQLAERVAEREHCAVEAAHRWLVRLLRGEYERVSLWRADTACTVIGIGVEALWPEEYWQVS